MVMRDIKYEVLQPPSKIGIIGGGQLGRMMTVEAKRMGYHVTVFDPTPSSPAAQVADEQVIASFMDTSAIEKLAGNCDVITYEFEHINADILIDLEEKGYRVYPSGKSLKKIQDKYVQKEMLKNAGILVPEYMIINDIKDMSGCIDTIGIPFILKTRSGGYDGKGNFVIKTREQIGKAMEEFKGYNLMAERFVEFERELSTIVVRNLKNDCVVYPIVENIHENSILHLTKVPSNIDSVIEKKVRDIVVKIMEVLDDYGVFCIEMFLAKNGEVYVNEIAPRPHNSGHYTIEACATSQFEQLVRVITGMPLGSTELCCPCVMVNILGNDTVEGQYRFEGIEDVLDDHDVHLHLYGKQSTKNMKKIGHITVLNNSVEVAEQKALTALGNITIKPL
jgi:5-(carboxyamino)imidazole ribonucleotide synthase